MQLSWAQCAVQRFGPKTEHGAVLCCTEFWCAVVTLVGQTRNSRRLPKRTSRVTRPIDRAARNKTKTEIKVLGAVATRVGLVLGREQRPKACG